MKPSAVALLMAIVMVVLLAPSAHASGHLEMVPGETSVTVPPNGEVIVDVSAFCVNFGEPFPKAVTWSPERVSDDVFKVMKAAAVDGAGTSDVLQTQIAIWHAIEGEWGYKDKDVDLTVAKRLADEAVGQTAEPLLGRGTPLDEAVKAGSVKVTVNRWVQADAPKALPTDAPYYGTGALTIENLTTEAIDVYVPLGVLLKAADEAEQDMGVYAVTQQEKEMPKTLPATGGVDRSVGYALLAGLLAVLAGLTLARRQRAPIANR